MYAERTDRMESFYKLKIAEGLTHDQAMEKVKSKFNPGHYSAALLTERLQANPKGQSK